MQKKRYKVLTAVLAAAIAVSLSACGSSGDTETVAETEEAGGDTQEETEAEEDATEAAEDESEEEAAEEEASAQTETYDDIVLIETELDEGDEGYAEALFMNELNNFKTVRNLPTAYESTSWDDYYTIGNGLNERAGEDDFDISSITEEDVALAKSASEARKQLVQIKSAEDSMWLIWGDDMPVTKGEASITYTPASQDFEGFAPFLVPYLLQDQSSVKGNVIVIAGGGYYMRSNTGEGYPVAEQFNELGYNAYVLQRRVDPYEAEDSWMDLQRSIRYLRYNADALGIGGTDCIVATGFSGGGATIVGCVANVYGDISPTIYDATYVEDDVDSESADLDVACIIYGPIAAVSHEDTFEGLVTDNENLPAFFIAAGFDDTTGAGTDSITLAKSLNDLEAAVELHVFAYVGHGFNLGTTGNNSGYWTDMANDYIENTMSRAGINAGSSDSADGQESEAAEIPDGYSKYQTVSVTMGFGNVDATVYYNDDDTAYYIEFEAFSEEQVLEGTLDGGVATNLYDKTGFMGGEVQTIIDAVDPSVWK